MHATTNTTTTTDAAANGVAHRDAVRYDRQLRLWGAPGQLRLATATVLVAGVSRATAEAAKALVLPGAGRVAIADHVVCDGCRRLAALNTQCAVCALSLGPAALASVAISIPNCSPDAVVATTDRVSPATLAILATHMNTPIVAVSTVGLVAAIRVTATRLLGVADSHATPTPPDLALARPFPELINLLDNVVGASTSHKSNSSVETILPLRGNQPFPLVLLAVARVLWPNGVPLPQLPCQNNDNNNDDDDNNNIAIVADDDIDEDNSRTDRVAKVRELLREARAQALRDLAANSSADVLAVQSIDDALRNAHAIVADPRTVPRALADLLRDPRVNPATRHHIICSADAIRCPPPLWRAAHWGFWFVLRALARFRTLHNGSLPLAGSLPDMHADSGDYAALRTVYASRAAADRAEIAAMVVADAAKELVAVRSPAPAMSLYVAAERVSSAEDPVVAARELSHTDSATILAAVGLVHADVDAMCRGARHLQAVSARSTPLGEHVACGRIRTMLARDGLLHLVTASNVLDPDWSASSIASQCAFDGIPPPATFVDSNINRNNVAICSNDPHPEHHDSIAINTNSIVLDSVDSNTIDPNTLPGLDLAAVTTARNRSAIDIAIAIDTAAEALIQNGGEPPICSSVDIANTINTSDNNTNLLLDDRVTKSQPVSSTTDDDRRLPASAKGRVKRSSDGDPVVVTSPIASVSDTSADNIEAQREAKRTAVLNDFLTALRDNVLSNITGPTKDEALADVQRFRFNTQLSMEYDETLSRSSDDLVADSESAMAHLCLHFFARTIFRSVYGRFPGDVAAILADNNCKKTEFQLLDEDLDALVAVGERLLELVASISDPNISQSWQWSRRISAEIVRYGVTDIASTSAIAGGIVAQEAVKLITQQYVPLGGTLIFNGIRSSTAIFQC